MFLYNLILLLLSLCLSEKEGQEGQGQEEGQGGFLQSHRCRLEEAPTCWTQPLRRKRAGAGPALQGQVPTGLLEL